MNSLAEQWLLKIMGRSVAGELVEILEQLLETFCCPPETLVKISSFYDGEVIGEV